MSASEAASRYTYSARLISPFVRLLRDYPEVPAAVLDPLIELDPDERFPASVLHELLRGAIVLTGDENIGLKAAGQIEQGDYGALEYAASSCDTAGQAIEVIGRYLALVNDGIDFSLAVEGERAVVRLDSAVPLPRPVEAFQSAAFYSATMIRGLPRPQGEYEVWFTHQAPVDTAQYHATFPDMTVRFAQPQNAFVMPAVMLAVRLPSADPKLHAVIRKHADALLAELPKVDSFTDRVRHLVMEQMRGGSPGVQQVAEQLYMSPRTLGRRLGDEGTSFKEIVDDLRRALAVRYVADSELGLSEVAFLLGFSQSGAFHRAFKRWVGQTPLEYRRRAREHSSRAS